MLEERETMLEERVKTTQQKKPQQSAHTKKITYHDAAMRVTLITSEKASEQKQSKAATNFTAITSRNPEETRRPTEPSAAAVVAAAAVIAALEADAWCSVNGWRF
jgi:hypothetical protein